MKIKITVNDDNRSIYYSTETESWETAEMELDRIKRNYEKELEREEFLDDHVRLEQYD